jgi:hypothetical protein
MKLTTKEIVFLFCVFVAGCFCAFYANTNTKPHTPAEFLNEKPMEPPQIELGQGDKLISSIDNDPRLETIEISYTVGGNVVTEKEHKCAGCHWKCCQ